jgi:hypothetical protein
MMYALFELSILSLIILRRAMRRKRTQISTVYPGRLVGELLILRAQLGTGWLDRIARREIDRNLGAAELLLKLGGHMVIGVLPGVNITPPPKWEKIYRENINREDATNAKED